jgi:hypothetical protein
VVGDLQPVQSRPGQCQTLQLKLQTPWSRVLPEKPADSELVKFPAFYGTLMFINAFTSARYVSLSWARSIQSTPPYPTSWKCIFRRVRKIVKRHCLSSACLAVRMRILGSQQTDFHEIWYLSIFPKSIEEIQVSLKSDENDGHFTWRPVYIFISCRTLRRMRNYSDKSCRENQNTHFMFNNFFFPKIARLWDVIEKCGTTRQAAYDNIIRRMRIAWWIPKATDTRSEYVTRNALTRQHRSH